MAKFMSWLAPFFKVYDPNYKPWERDGVFIPELLSAGEDAETLLRNECPKDLTDNFGSVLNTAESLKQLFWFSRIQKALWDVFLHLCRAGMVFPTHIYLDIDVSFATENECTLITALRCFDIFDFPMAQCVFDIHASDSAFLWLAKAMARGRVPTNVILDEIKKSRLLGNLNEGLRAQLSARPRLPPTAGAPSDPSAYANLLADNDHAGRWHLLRKKSLAGGVIAVKKETNKPFGFWLPRLVYKTIDQSDDDCLKGEDRRINKWHSQIIKTFAWWFSLGERDQLLNHTNTQICRWEYIQTQERVSEAQQERVEPQNRAQAKAATPPVKPQPQPTQKQRTVSPPTSLIPQSPSIPYSPTSTATPPQLPGRAPGLEVRSTSAHQVTTNTNNPAFAPSVQTHSTSRGQPKALTTPRGQMRITSRNEYHGSPPRSRDIPANHPRATPTACSTPTFTEDALSRQCRPDLNGHGIITPHHGNPTNGAGKKRIHEECENLEADLALQSNIKRTKTSHESQHRSQHTPLIQQTSQPVRAPPQKCFIPAESTDSSQMPVINLTSSDLALVGEFQAQLIRHQQTSGTYSGPLTPIHPQPTGLDPRTAMFARQIGAPVTYQHNLNPGGSPPFRRVQVQRPYQQVNGLGYPSNAWNPQQQFHQQQFINPVGPSPEVRELCINGATINTGGFYEDPMFLNG